MNTSLCVKSQNIIYKCESHKHQEWELVLNLYGQAIYTIGEKSFLFKENDLLIIPPNTPHNAISNSGFSDIYIRAYNLDFIKIHKAEKMDNDVINLFNMLQKVLLEKATNYEKIADSILNVIVQYIKKSIQITPKYAFAYDLKDIIFNNISNPNFSLKEQIKKTGFDKDYFRRCFQFEFGKTPHEYLTDLRIDLAKTLLIQETYISVQKIAEQCGYNDNLYFSTCFKKHVGVSPLEYRKRFFDI